MLPLLDLVQGSRLAFLSKNRQAEAQVALAENAQLTFSPVSGHKAAIITQLDFAVPSPYLCGRPIARVGSLTTVAATYGTVATWTVATGRSGRLTEISLDSNNLAKTNWQLTIGGVQQFTAFNPRSPLSIPFRDNQLPPGAIALLEAASTDATSVVTYGSIAAQEFFDHLFRVNIQKAGWLFQHDLRVTQELIDHGLPMFAVITSDSPLILEVTNPNGIGNEPFVAIATQYNLIDEKRLDALLDMIEGMIDTLALEIRPDSPIGGACGAALRMARSNGRK